MHDVWDLRTVDDMKYQGSVLLDNYLGNQDMPQRPFFLGGIPGRKPSGHILWINGMFAVAVDGGKAIIQHLGIVIVQNLDDIPERTDQQHLIQMGCLTAAMVPVPMTAFPQRVVIGGGVPILPPIAVATVGAEDLIGEQGEGRTVPIRVLQPILHLHEHHFGYDAWVAVLNEVTGQFAVIDPLFVGDVIGNICFL